MKNFLISNKEECSNQSNITEYFYRIDYLEEKLQNNDKLNKLINEFCNKYYREDHNPDIYVIDKDVIKINDQYWSSKDMKLALSNNISENILFDYYDYSIQNHRTAVKNYTNVLDYLNDL